MLYQNPILDFYIMNPYRRVAYIVRSTTKQFSPTPATHSSPPIIWRVKCFVSVWKLFLLLCYHFQLKKKKIPSFWIGLNKKKKTKRIEYGWIDFKCYVLLFFFSESAAAAVWVVLILLHFSLLCLKSFTVVGRLRVCCSPIRCVLYCNGAKLKKKKLLFPFFFFLKSTFRLHK